MPLKDQIEKALTDRFHPEFLEVINESRLHAGHNPEAARTGETHFRLRIAAASLSGLNRVNRHRAVNNALDFAFKEGLHALAIEFGPEAMEAARRVGS
jgi:BolA protein